MNTLSIVTLVPAAVSISIWILSIPLEPLKEKMTYTFRLKTEYKYREKKKIKNVISNYKMQLIDAAYSLSERLFNYKENFKWLSVQAPDYWKNHFLISTEFRFLNFFAWVKKTEAEMIYIDITIADKEDLEFIKFLKLFNAILCDVRLISDVDSKYDTEHQADHFFSDRFDAVCSVLALEQLPVSFLAFDRMVEKKSCELHDDNFDLTQFLVGINPEENRYRWDMLELLHLLIIPFLNTYGYDYQYINEKRICNSLKRRNKLFSGFKEKMKQYHLDTQKEMKRTIKIIEKNFQESSR